MEGSELCSGINCGFREHCKRYQPKAKGQKGLKPPGSLPASCSNFVPRTSYGSCSPGAGEQLFCEKKNGKS